MEYLRCAGCGDRLDESAALLVSPADADGRARRTDLCVDCWPAIPGILGRLGSKVPPTRVLAEAFARLSDDDQAQFFIEVASIAAEWAPGGIHQWYAVGRHLATCSCSTPEARDLVRDIAAGAGVE